MKFSLRNISYILFIVPPSCPQHWYIDTMIQWYNDTISLLFPNLLPRSYNEFLPKKNNMSDIHSQEHVTLLVGLNLIETDFFPLMLWSLKIKIYVSGKFLAHWINKTIVDTILAYFWHTYAICTVKHVLLHKWHTMHC